MSIFQAAADQILADGKITPNEVKTIKECMAADGVLDYADAKFLVGLMREAKEICSEFDDLFFPCLQKIILDDNEVTLDEQFLLLQMLYSDGEVRDVERKFLLELYRSVDNVTPEFHQLCETALNCEDTNWDLGGR